MNWERKKLNVKQPGIEEEEYMMSRHLDGVATSTLNQKQSRHQLARRKRSRQLQFKKEGRDNNSEDKMSRHHLVVATVIALKRRSRHHSVVMTTNPQKRRSRHQSEVATAIVKTRCHDNI